MLRDIIDSLPTQERDQLMYAFEHEFSQDIVLPNGKFIGVNLTGKEAQLEIVEEVGVWCYGNKVGTTQDLK